MPDQKRTDALDWEDLRYFLAMTRYSSLSATARALKVNHATVARRLSALEATLGHDLYDRRTGRYTLTKEGELVLEEALLIEAAVLAIQNQLVSGAELRGLVRLTTILPLADHFLISRLGEFTRRYPGIDIEIITDLRVMSLARREADIALRFGRPKDGDIVGRQVGRVAYAYYATAIYRRKLEKGETPVLIGYDDDNSFVPAGAWMRRHFRQHRLAFRSNSYTSQAAAARASLGIALLPCYLADPDLSLVRVDFGDVPPARDLWLLTRRDLARTPRIRVIVDHLVELFRREQAILSGSGD